MWLSALHHHRASSVDQSKKRKKQSASWTPLDPRSIHNHGPALRVDGQTKVVLRAGGSTAQTLDNCVAELFQCSAGPCCVTICPPSVA
mmetsp:Transcript_16791/g.18691  ORF Transcript_16791/g.18691 Transcript_16791/m.18691 type:complete len:88 (+) Transcript_16791:355-618(+)